MLNRLMLLWCIVAVTACSTSREIESQLVLEEMQLQESGPTQFTNWIHTPLRPLDYQPLSFLADFNSAEGIAHVELLVFEYELYRNELSQPSQRKRKQGHWGTMRTWDFAATPKFLSLSHVANDGFGPHTRLEYVWRVTDADGEVTDRFARLDAGTSPWPKNKVLLYSTSRRPMEDVIDLGFFRDTDYNDDLTAFNRDVERMVTEGFLNPTTFGNDRHYWAFYTTDQSANGRKISEDVLNSDLLPSFVQDFSIPGIDAFCLLHKEDYTDRSLLVENFHELSNNLFSAEAHNFGTAVHESGHAIFHLSDEYDGCACFQAHNSSNVFQEKSECQQWSIENGFPARECHEIKDIFDDSWYSAEPATMFKNQEECWAHNERIGLRADSCRTFINKDGDKMYWAFESSCIMHDDGDNIVRHFQRACAHVINEQYDVLLNAKIDGSFAVRAYNNIYGYDLVDIIEASYDGAQWTTTITGQRQGVPTRQFNPITGSTTLSIRNSAGIPSEFQVGYAGACHQEANEEVQEIPKTGRVKFAASASSGL